MNEREVAIVIYANGEVEIVGPVAIGAINAAIERLSGAVRNVMVAPSVPPNGQNEAEKETAE